MVGPDTGSSQAWVTLATNDSYCLGALVLGHSLIRSGTTRRKVVMISTGVSAAMRGQLEATFDEVISVEELDSKDIANLTLLERPELGITFTKLHCWNLTQYEKCIFLDADTLVLRNSDELFDKEEFSAAPDAGWPDCFNSGVFVYRPSHDTYKAIMRHANTEGSFDGGDQGLLNTFFNEWATKDIGKHLSFLYNMCATATYTYLPAYKKYGHQVKIIHFIGASKPWHVQFDPSGQPQPRLGEEHTVNHLKQWWHIFHSDVKPNLGEKLCSTILGFCPSAEWCRDHHWSGQQAMPVLQGKPVMHMTPGGGATFVPPQHGSQQQPQQQARSGDSRVTWEEGQPDYLGTASFDNILKKIESTMTSPDIFPSPPTVCDYSRYSSLPCHLDEISQFPISHEDKFETDHSSHREESPQHSRGTTSYHDQHYSSPSRHISGPSPARSDSNLHYKGDYHMKPLEDNKMAWERGSPDYMGRNAFDHIRAKLDAAVDYEDPPHHSPDENNHPPPERGHESAAVTHGHESAAEHGTEPVRSSEPTTHTSPHPPQANTSAHTPQVQSAEPPSQPIPRPPSGFDLILQTIESSLGEKIAHSPIEPFKPILPTRISKRHQKFAVERENALKELADEQKVPHDEKLSLSNGTTPEPTQFRRVLGRGRARKLP